MFRQALQLLFKPAARTLAEYNTINETGIHSIPNTLKNFTAQGAKIGAGLGAISSVTAVLYDYEQSKRNHERPSAEHYLTASLASTTFGAAAGGFFGLGLGVAVAAPGVAAGTAVTGLAALTIATRKTY